METGGLMLNTTGINLFFFVPDFHERPVFIVKDFLIGP